MRALFLMLAALLAAVVAALLLGPRLLDGEMIRGQLLARLESASAQPVRVLGATSLTFFPEPRLSLSEMVVGEPQRGDWSARVERVDLLLGFASLLGAFSGIREVRLVRPQLRSTALPSPAVLGALLDRLRDGGMPVEALSVINGRLVLRDSRLAAPVELHDLDLEAAIETGGGRLALTGGGRWRDQALAVDLELRPTAVGPIPARVQLRMGSGPSASRIAYRGVIAIDVGAPRLDGEVEVAAETGRLARLLEDLTLASLADGMPAIGPFAARGRLRADDGRIDLQGLRIASAAGEVAGSLSLDLSRPVDLRLELEAARLELPSELRPAAALHRFWRGPPDGLVGTLLVRIGTLARGGEEVRLLHLDAKLPGRGGLLIERLGAELPGTGDLELSGSLVHESAGPTYRGRLSLRLEDPQPFLVWLGADVPAPARRLGAIAISGELYGTPEGVSLSGADIRAAGARGRGTFAWLAGPPPRLVLRGGIDRFTLEPALEALSAEAASLWLTAGPPQGIDIEADLVIERLAWRGLRAERVRLKGELASGRLRLDEIAAADPGGAAARLAGTLGPGGGADLALELVVDQPARFARALDLDLGFLALLDGPLRSRSRLDQDENGRRFEVAIEGAGVRLQADARLAPGSLEPERLHLSTEVVEIALLAARLGGRGSPAGRLAGRLVGELAAARSAVGWRIDGRLSAGQIHFETGLDLTADDPVPKLRGRLMVDALDSESVGELYRLLEVPLGLPHGPMRGWPGAWPRQPFGPPRLPEVDLELALEVGLATADGHSLGKGGAMLSFAGQALALDGLDLPLVGGRLSGRMLAELAGGAGRIDAELALASADLAILLSTLRSGEPTRGILDVEIALETAGRSPAELIANAAGRGAFTLRDLPLGDLLPGSPAGASLLRGPLVLERGVVRAPELLLDIDGASGRAALAFDLLAWILDLELRDASAGVRLLGPPDRLRRYPSEPAR